MRRPRASTSTARSGRSCPIAASAATARRGEAQGEAAPRHARGRAQGHRRRLAVVSRAIPRSSELIRRITPRLRRRRDAAAGVAPVADGGGEGAARSAGCAKARSTSRTGRSCRCTTSRCRGARRGRDRGINPIDAFVARAAAAREACALRAAAHAPKTLIRRVTLDLTGPAADAGRDRRLPRRPIAARLREGRRPLPRLARLRRAHGDATGSTSPATPTRTATRSTATATCGRTATGSSGRSTRTCPSTSSSPGSSPATCCRTPTREQRLATAFNRLHMQNEEGGIVEEEFRVAYVVDRVEHDRHRVPRPDVRVRAAATTTSTTRSRRRTSTRSSRSSRTSTSPGRLALHQRDARRRRCCCGRRSRSSSTAAGERASPRREAQLARQARAARRAHLSMARVGRRQARDAESRAWHFDDVRDGDTPDSMATMRQIQDGLHWWSEPSTRSESNGALRFSGENALVRRRAASSPATDPFSLGLWLKPTAAQDRGRRRAPVARVDRRRQPRLRAAARGRPAVLRPHPHVAGQPRCARASRRCRSNDWSHVAVTYDGSSRAAGVRLYLNGAPARD